MPPSPRIVVVGSLNMDLVVRAPRRPAKGETLHGDSFATFIGGKGNNQAIAAARCGGAVTMVGRVGNDGFGAALLDKLAAEGINARHVRRDAEHSTGIAAITVDAEGDNSIIIVAGANGALSPADVDAAAEAIGPAHSLLLQLEIPLTTARHATMRARQASCRVILNPAPAQRLAADFLSLVDILIPNEGEASLLSGQDDAPSAAAALRAAYPQLTVIVTLGEKGAYVAAPEGTFTVPAYSVPVVDTTAAGDAFCGALAVALGRGESLRDAVRFACAAGALTVTKAGAEASLPHAAEVERLRAGG